MTSTSGFCKLIYLKDAQSLVLTRRFSFLFKNVWPSEGHINSLATNNMTIKATETVPKAKFAM